MIPSANIKNEDIYTLPEAARLLGRSSRQIRRWCEAQLIRYGQDVSGKLFFKGEHIIEKRRAMTAGIKWV